MNISFRVPITTSIRTTAIDSTKVRIENVGEKEYNNWERMENTRNRVNKIKTLALTVLTRELSVDAMFNPSCITTQNAEIKP